MNVDVLQSVNSFMGQFGLAISNKKQILAKVTAVALAAILLVGNVSLAEAGDCRQPCWDNCFSGCTSDAQTCMRRCLSRCCE